MIHRYRVQNFKSISDVTVDLNDVTVLVGRSGTGKSNFVQSLRFLRDILSPHLNADRFNKLWPQVRPALNSNAISRFAVEFTIAGIREQFKYELTLSSNGPVDLPLEERLELGDQPLFHQRREERTEKHRASVRMTQSQPEWLVPPALVQVPKAGQIAIGRIPALSEVVIAFTALTSGIGCYVFDDKVLCGNPTAQSTIGLDDQANNYLQAIQEIVSNLQDLSVRKSIVASLRRVNPSVASVELNDIQQPTHVVVGHSFNGKTLDLELPRESDGFRRFYAHLLALYQRPPKQTLIFEHPEDGIHPGALTLLAEEFEAAPTVGRGQVIFTTHNPKLLDQFSVEQIRVVELRGFETRIGPVSQEQKEAIQENLLQPGELLSVDPARIYENPAEAQST